VKSRAGILASSFFKNCRKVESQRARSLQSVRRERGLNVDVRVMKYHRIGWCMVGEHTLSAIRKEKGYLDILPPSVNEIVEVKIL
jgi:hypothetical protein